SALGSKFRLSNDGPFFEVIGVVGNTQYRPQNEAPPPAFYLPLAQQFLPDLSLIVRTENKPEALLAPLRQTIQGLDRNLPIIASGTMQTHIQETFWPLQIALAIFGLLSAMALLLAAIGIYVKLRQWCVTSEMSEDKMSRDNSAPYMLKIGHKSCLSE